MKNFKLNIFVSCLLLSVLLLATVLLVVIVLVTRNGNNIENTWDDSPGSLNDKEERVSLDNVK